MENPVFEVLLERFNVEQATASQEVAEDLEEGVILRKRNIRLGLKTVERDEAIRMAGRMLYESGYVNENYIEAMLERKEI